MFCPKCGTQNVEGASFCRLCGANIGLVSQALAGQLSAPDEVKDRKSRRKRKREPSIEEAIRGIAMGIAFAVVSILVMLYAPAGQIWWFWLLIPAFGWLGTGIGQVLKIKNSKQLEPIVAQPQLNTVRLRELPATQTNELPAPMPSVTEGTTRHLSTEPPAPRLASDREQ
jgi:hypothetical protein